MRIYLTTEKINTGPQALTSLAAQGAWLHVCAACAEAGGDVALALLKLRHPEIKEPLRELHASGVIEISDDMMVSVPEITQQIERKTSAAKAARVKWSRESGPSIDDVKLYAAENGIAVDCEKFHGYYMGRKWKTSQGRPVTNWQGMLKKWGQRE